jgi:hypothetical protein
MKMKMILSSLMLLFGLMAQAQSPRQGAVSCPAHIDLEITRQAGQTVYKFQNKSTPKYPLDTVGALASRCPQIRGMVIVVDSTVPLDDILTALNGSGKNQVDQVSIFIRKNGFYLPLTVGDPSSKDPTK